MNRQLYDSLYVSLTCQKGTTPLGCLALPTPRCTVHEPINDSGALSSTFVCALLPARGDVQCEEQQWAESLKITLCSSYEAAAAAAAGAAAAAAGVVP
jgi:hypothetical protein